MRRRHRTRGKRSRRSRSRPASAPQPGLDAATRPRPRSPRPGGGGSAKPACATPPALIVQGRRAPGARRARDERDGSRGGGPAAADALRGHRGVRGRCWSSPCSGSSRLASRVPRSAGPAIASSAAASRNSQPMGSASSSKSKRGLWCGWSSPRAAFDEPTNTKQPGHLLEVDGHVLAAHGGLGTHDLLRAHHPLRRAPRELRDRRDR